jgi:hypothetical protein
LRFQQFSDSPLEDRRFLSICYRKPEWGTTSSGSGGGGGGANKAKPLVFSFWQTSKSAPIPQFLATTKTGSVDRIISLPFLPDLFAFMASYEALAS